ncbi:MAG: hypothetical protein BWX59_00210 [Bacteroidetes bacterium ADurb.Bin028]|jgi:hypothetical protein|nr:MAG: hypothetical protein BWX59_00210 [Bacteroidetes bacterium ADurb.Bin028]
MLIKMLYYLKNYIFVETLKHYLIIIVVFILLDLIYK